MLSQFFVLSPRGDTIVSRDYRHDVSRSSHDAFFRALKFGTGGEEGDVAPVFLLDGVNYFHVKARLRRAPALGSLSLPQLTRARLP
jgi:AP-4 complex subunit mu-1